VGTAENVLDGTISQVNELRELAGSLSSNSTRLLELKGSILSLQAEIASQNEARRKELELLALQNAAAAQAERQNLAEQQRQAEEQRLAVAEARRLEQERIRAAEAAAAQGGGGGLPGWDGAVFAAGGVFGGSGIVSTPTPFTYGSGKLGVMGEAGEEAVMPLKRLGDGSLGVRALTSYVVQQSGSTELLAEMRALRQELNDLRAEARATAINTASTARTLDRVTQGTDALIVQQVEAVA